MYKMDYHRDYGHFRVIELERIDRKSGTLPSGLSLKSYKWKVTSGIVCRKQGILKTAAKKCTWWLHVQNWGTGRSILRQLTTWILDQSRLHKCSKLHLSSHLLQVEQLLCSAVLPIIIAFASQTVVATLSTYLSTSFANSLPPPPSELHLWEKKELLSHITIFVLGLSQLSYVCTLMIGEVQRLATTATSLVKRFLHCSLKM